jgi:hypothetical protein
VVESGGSAYRDQLSDPLAINLNIIPKIGKLEFMRGSLTKISIPELLRTIYIERHTGELILEQGEIKKQIYFELGQIVFATSNQEHDRLGQTLIRYGKLTPTQLSQFLEVMKPEFHLGQLLVANQILTERELTAYLTFQITDIIYSLFNWTVGDYEFASEVENSPPEDLKLRFSTATIILEGVRRIADFAVVRRGLGDLNRLIAPNSSPLLRLQAITLKPLERQVLELVTRPMDLLQILIAVPEATRNVLQAAYGLLATGLLQQTSAPEISPRTGRFVVPQNVRRQAASAAPPQYTAQTTAPQQPASPALDSTPPPAAPAASNVAQNTIANTSNDVTKEIAAMRQRLLTGDPYTILGLKPPASAVELRDAYYRLAMWFHPDRFIQWPRQVREEIEQIFNRLTESYNMIRASTTVAARPGAAKAPTPIMPPPATTTGMLPPNSTSPNTNLLAQTLPNQTANPRSTANSYREFSYPGFGATPASGEGKDNVQSAQLEKAISDLLQYLDGRKAPLFVADSLALLFKTKAPVHIEWSKLVDILAGWARQKATITRQPVYKILISVVSSVRHAEKSRVLPELESQKFYSNLIQSLAGCCPPQERPFFYAEVTIEPDI